MSAPSKDEIAREVEACRAIEQEHPLSKTTWTAVIAALAGEVERLRAERVEVLALLTGGTYECDFRSAQEYRDECPGEKYGDPPGPCWDHRVVAMIAKLRGAP